MKLFHSSCLAFFLSTLAVTTFAQQSVNVTMNRYNTSRLAANTTESVLKQGNVNTAQFGKLWSYPVDGVIFGQPLYVQKLTIGGASHNVLFVATMNDVIYAFDADSSNTTPLWMRDLKTGGATAAPSEWTTEMGNSVGIISTPVIDTPSDSGSMYLVAETLESNVWTYRVHKISLTTGADVVPSTIIKATTNGVTFDPVLENQRTGLVLVNGQLIVCFSARPPDTTPFHGWIMSFDATTLARKGAFVTTTSDDGAGIWGSGGAPPVDSAGNVYALTGNAFNSATGYNGTTNFSESLLKMTVSSSTGALSLADWFTAYNWADLDVNDEDLSVNSPMLLPNTDLIAFGSKTADVYVAHTGSLGHLQNNNSQLAAFFHVGQPLQTSFSDGDRMIGLAYWVAPGGPTLFAWPALDSLHSYTYNPANGSFTETSSNPLMGFGEPGMPISVSANGSTAGTGVVWSTMFSSSGRAVGQAGVLHAFNGENLKEELWNTSINSNRDNVGSPSKFVIPVVANGRLYMATSSNVVQVYGLLPSPPTTTAAHVVSVDFVGNGTPMAPTEAAGVVPKGNWNAAIGNYRITPLPLTDENGALNGATMTWSSDTTWSTAIADSPGSGRMMKGYLDTGGSNHTSINVAGLPASATGYDVYVYVDGDNGANTRSTTFTLAAGNSSSMISATDSANANFGGSFTVASNSPGNVVRFSSVQATSFSLTATPGNASDGLQRAPVNGIQIVPSGAVATTYNISGQITSGNGSPLDGVTIALNTGASAITDSSGNYSFGNLPAGTYTVTPTAGGYSFQPANQSFTLGAGSSTTKSGVNFSASASYTGSARVVSIDFVGNGTPMALTETAGVVAKTNWNSAAGSVQASGLSLTDETGALNGALATWSSDTAWSTPISDSPGNLRMMKGYLDSGGTNQSTVTVSGLPVSSTGYDIYVYTDGDNGSGTRSATYALNGGGTAYTPVSVTDAANTNFTGTFTPASGSVGNYVKFAAVTATAFTLTATPSTASDGFLRAAINGIQIVPTGGAAPTYSVTGQITASNSGLTGVSVALNNGSTTTTDSSGNYSFSNLPGGSYTVTPSLSGYTFNPTSQTFTLSANKTGVNFTATSSSSGGAHTVSIDFVGNGTPMALTETAGVIPKTNWNSATGNSHPSALALADETGALNGAVVTWTGDAGWSTPIVDAAGNARMMKGYLDAGGTSHSTVTVSGLPVSATGYDVYVYTDGDNGSNTRSTSYVLTPSGSAGTTITATDTAGTNFNGTFSPAANSSGNYVKFASISATSFTLVSTPGTASDGTLRAPVNGIQIVPSGMAIATYRISGQVVAGGSGLVGVKVSLSNGTTTTSDSSGNYSFANLGAGTYTVTPSVSGYTFSPTSSTFTLSATTTGVAGANFTGTSAYTGIARVVSIDFTGNGTPMATTESAGTVLKSNWNGASGNLQPSALPLDDETGVLNGALATWSADAIWGTPIVDSAGNARMMKGYIDSGNTDSSTVNVSGLPASSAGYDIYVYTDGDNGSAARAAKYQITAAGNTVNPVTATDSANTNFGGTFTAAANSAGNYVKFAAVKATAFTLTATPSTASDGTLRAAINGIQIVPAVVVAPTYALSGQVTLSGSGLAGVSVALSTGAQATTDAMGRYSFPNLSGGSYTVTPTATGYTFTPTSQTLTLSANQTSVNFTASSTVP